eukprot:1983283-Amphidinium_carterae.1
MLMKAVIEKEEIPAPCPIEQRLLKPSARRKHSAKYVTLGRVVTFRLQSRGIVWVSQMWPKSHPFTIPGKGQQATQEAG